MQLSAIEATVLWIIQKEFFIVESSGMGVWKNSIEFFRISLFAIIVYKWLKSYVKKHNSPTP